MKNNKVLVTLLSILVIVLLGGVGYIGYKLLTEDTKTSEEADTATTVEKEDTPEEEVVEDSIEAEETDAIAEPEEPVVESQIPDGWLEQTSDTYQYSIGVPETWYYRFFGGTKMIGLDPNAIPEASEYAGIITFTAESGSAEDMVTAYTSGLIGVTQEDKIVNSNVWKQYMGKTSPDDIFYADNKVIHSFFTKDGITYKLGMMAAEESYSSNLAMYNQILETISFQD